MELLTVNAVAKELGITSTSVYNYIDRGILPPDVTVVTDGITHHRFTRESVDEFFASCITGNYKKGDKLMCSGDAADYIGVGQSTFNDYVKRGRINADVVLPAPRTGKSGRRLFTLDTLDAFKSTYSRYGRVQA